MPTKEKQNYNPEPKVWRYELPGGWIVLAGKTDDDNDILSLRTARPNDWWFHIRGMPGSHVIMQAHEGEQPDNRTLKAAASIAAWHSKARNAGVVPVASTLAVNVSKRRGAKPGSVMVKREKILKVRPGIPEDLNR
jgi:predicted ribosome quality control (RQC) complex YloA/Tae2 family protein